jgi:low temperature requirement protein LtrA
VSLRRPPHLRTIDDADEERRASALELFFDLVFVVAVAQLGETLSRHISAAGFLHFAVVFVPVWWAWVGYTVYADRFDTDDIVFRLAMLTAMLAVAWLAIEIPSAFDDAAGGARFAAAYAAVRFGLVGLYLRADHHEPRARPLTGRYIAGFGTGATIWLASAFTTAPARYVLWGIAIAIELTPPLLSSAVFLRVPLHVSHIPEWFAAFTIIALGETVVLVATGMAQGHLRAGGAVAAVFGFIIAASIWWLYFDFSTASPLGRGPLAPQTYAYGHLIIVGGITATGVGTLLAIHADGATLTAGARWALCGGTAAFLSATSQFNSSTPAVRATPGSGSDSQQRHCSPRWPSPAPASRHTP